MLLNILDRQCSLICGTGTKFYEHRREWIRIRYWKQSLYSKSLNNVQVMKIKLECATISLHRQQKPVGRWFPYDIRNIPNCKNEKKEFRLGWYFKLYTHTNLKTKSSASTAESPAPMIFPSQMSRNEVGWFAADNLTTSWAYSLVNKSGTGSSCYKTKYNPQIIQTLEA